MGSKGGGSQTIGYKYFIGMHFVPCYGPVDEISELIVGERTAWTGSVIDDGTITIDKPGLFGGEKKEGGVAGDVQVAMGKATQTKPQYLVDRLGSTIPAYRGVLSLIAKQCYIGTSAYMKSWWWRIQRISIRADGKPTWYSSKIQIGDDMNPAHIVHECLTDSVWGMGYPYADMDDAAFQAAADILYNEGFGMSLIWDKQQKLLDFVKEVLRHIDGSLYQDPATGQIVLKLIRAESTVAKTFDESNAELEDFNREGWGETTNQVTVKYTEPETGKEKTYTVQNLANVQIQGGTVAQTQNYTGVTKHSIAAMLASRDLTQMSRPLAKARLITNRDGYDVRIGDLLELNWPDLGISGFRVRVTGAEYGSIDEGRCIFDIVEDVFQDTTNVFSDPQPTNWSEPNLDPQPAPAEAVYEVPYTTLAFMLGADSAEAKTADDAYASLVAARPSTAINYEADFRVSGGNWTSTQTGDFTPWGVLAADVGYTDGQITLQTSALDLDTVVLNEVLFVGNEAMIVTAVDEVNRVISVDRGTMDTVPKEHTAGDTVWFYGSERLLIADERSFGESMEFRIMPATSFGVLDEVSAAVLSKTMGRRHFLPYPPGRLRINSQAYPAVIGGDLALSWRHRDRIQQEDNLYDESAGNIGPETGVTYTLELYGEEDNQGNRTLGRTETGLTGTSYTWSTEGADTNNQALQGEVDRFEDDASFFGDWTAPAFSVRAGDIAHSVVRARSGEHSLKRTESGGAQDGAKVALGMSIDVSTHGSISDVWFWVPSTGVTGNRLLVGIGDADDEGHYVGIKESDGFEIGVLTGSSIFPDSDTNSGLVAPKDAWFRMRLIVRAAGDVEGIVYNPDGSELDRIAGGRSDGIYNGIHESLYVLGRYPVWVDDILVRKMDRVGIPNNSVRAVLRADRNGYTSFTEHDVVVNRAGWGLSWGENWGGSA